MQGQHTSLGTDGSLHFSSGIWLPSSRGDSWPYSGHATVYRVVEKEWMNFAIGTQEIEDSMDIESIAKRKQTSEVESTQIQICMSRCRPSLARREKCMRTVSSLKVTRASKTQHLRYLSTSSKDTEHKDVSCPQRKEF